jgi:exodeoxyribonuclease V gamma subunit
MLTIHTSNQLEQLKDQYATVVKTPLNDVFSKELVVVQNAGMSRWLSMEMANIAGISANTEFLFPAEFMWRLLRLVSPGIPEQSQCTPATLRFYIMQELSQNYQDYPEIQHYILANENINQLAVWDLAGEVSQLLDQYLFYRSEWIRDWESNGWATNHNWQARLWQRCVKEKGLKHWLTLQDQFKQSLATFDKKDTTEQHAELPERISFFSMAALSPGYLDLLGELAQKTNIHLYLINPCEDVYWGDIQSDKSRSKHSKAEQSYIDVGNPLLASMGKQGRDFIFKLLDIPDATNPTIDNFDSEFKTNDVSTLLQRIQQDIYTLQTPETLAKDIIKANQTDASLRFNACHTANREVEVLHDQILAELDKDANLAPSDIVVMMPDIENYAPYIESVFANSPFKLPFSIADREAKNVFNIVEALNKLFKLPESRFDVEAVFELLEYEDIRGQFDLDDNQLNYCRELAYATNIRWGINAKTRARNNLPETEEHTWKYALDRMLLGYSLADDSDAEQLFATDGNLSLLPYNEIEGSNALILSHFKRFTDAVFAISEWQYTSNTLNDWIEKTKTLIKQIIPENNDQQQVFKAMDELESNATVAQFDETLAFSVYQKMLQQCLQNISSGEKYLGYGITFCALVPMRSVPFKLVALLGMNDGQFPRRDKRPSFDLMANHKRSGDRSRRDEDRYLFLESILAARNKLIISYIGQSVKDNSKLPPSVLVSELLDSVALYTSKTAEEWIINHPLQAFSPRYFISNAEDDQTLFSYSNEYTRLSKNNQPPPAFFIHQKLEDLDDSYKKLTINELITFFKSPARAFLKQRFAIQTFDQDSTLPCREPFALESFKDREIRELLFGCAVDGTCEDMIEIEDKRLIARAKGLLPYGHIGDEIFNQQKQLIETFIEQHPPVERYDSKTINLTLGDYQLAGNLDHLCSQGRIVHQVSKPYAADYISLWINHLLLNIKSTDTNSDDSNDPDTSYFFSPEIKFMLRPVENPKQKLISLLNYYWQGLSYPLAFFPKTSLELFIANGTENTSGISDKWNGSDFYSGEKQKFENWLLHRNLEMNKDRQPEAFLQVSREFYGSLFEHLEETT